MNKCESLSWHIDIFCIPQYIQIKACYTEPPSCFWIAISEGEEASLTLAQHDHPMEFSPISLPREEAMRWQKTVRQPCCELISGIAPDVFGRAFRKQ